MNDSPDFIIGAGLAGLIAAHAWPQARILEASPEPREAHRALLRFRSDAVSRLTGIPFRRVRVHKGIWDGERGDFVAPSIRYANMYARKVLRLGGERSIWNVEPVERFIAPDDFYSRLLAAVGSRIAWDSPVDFSKSAFRRPVVSTAPLPTVLDSLKLPSTGCTFVRAPIEVWRFRLPDMADLFQTVYFPHHEDGPIYRASITGRTLIVEAKKDGELLDYRRVLSWVCPAFGISWDGIELEERVNQKFGKIEAAADDAARKALIYRLSTRHNIYSLGRFATWRNILLDDVVSDIDSLRRLMKQDAYGARLAA